MRLALAPLLAVVCLLAGCANPDYYLLPPPAASAQKSSPVASISVAEVVLPTYADAIEIPTLSDTGAVAVDNNALWADQPRGAITRHLARALQARLDAQVGTEPWPGFDAPGLRVEVQVDRLIGAPEGVLQFTGRYVLLAPASGRIVAFDDFAFSIPVEGVGYQGLLNAHSRAVDALADDLAARIRRLGRIA